MAGSLYNYITNSPQLWMLFPQFIWTWGGFVDGIVYSLKKSPRFGNLLSCCCFGGRDEKVKIVLPSLEEELIPPSIPGIANAKEEEKYEDDDDAFLSDNEDSSEETGSTKNYFVVENM